MDIILTHRIAKQTKNICMCEGVSSMLAVKNCNTWW